MPVHIPIGGLDRAVAVTRVARVQGAADTRVDAQLGGGHFKRFVQQGANPLGNPSQTLAAGALGRKRNSSPPWRTQGFAVTNRLRQPLGDALQ